MSYPPTNWQSGDTITSARLNKAEQGLQTTADVADKAKTAADKANSDAAKALTEASNAATDANNAVTDVAAAAQVANEAKASADGLVADVTKLKDNNLLMRRIDLFGDKDALLGGAKNTTMHFIYNDGKQKFECKAAMKARGDSSSIMPKIPFGLKLYTDDSKTTPAQFKPFSSWVATNAWNLNANFIDATHARTLLGADAARRLALNHVPEVGWNKAFNSDLVTNIAPKSDITKLPNGVGWDLIAGQKATISFDARDYGNDNKEFWINVDGYPVYCQFHTVKNGVTHYEYTFDVPKELKDPANNLFVQCTNKDFDANFEITNFKIIPGDRDITPIKSTDPYFATQSMGQVQGVPVQVFINGDFHGLMTLNTTSGPSLYGVPENYDQGFAVYVVQNSPAGKLQTMDKPLEDASEFGMVFGQLNDASKANWNRFRAFLQNPSDSVFKGQYPNYLDVEQVINNGILCDILNIGDVASKSQTWVTYDGSFFIPVLYDLDQAIQQSWKFADSDNSKGEFNDKLNGAYLNDQNGNLGREWFLPSEVQENLVYQRVWKCFPDRVKARYAELRKTIFSMDSIVSSYKGFIDGIPQEIYDADQAKWPIPSAKMNNVQFIQQAMARRFRYTDKMYGYKG